MNKKTILLLVALALAGSALFGWNYFSPPPVPVAQWAQAKEAPQLKGVVKQNLITQKVAVYAPAAKQKLNLPANIQNDASQYVLSSSRLPKDTHPATVTTVLDESTGEVQTYIRREPLPWLAPEQTGELRIDVGYKNGMTRAGRLTFREDLLQVKALHAGLNASIDTDGQYFVGAGVGYRW
jgi:hypothetical protein